MLNYTKSQCVVQFIFNSRLSRVDCAFFVGEVFRSFFAGGSLAKVRFILSAFRTTELQRYQECTL